MEEGAALYLYFSPDYPGLNGYNTVYTVPF